MYEVTKHAVTRVLLKCVILGSTIVLGCATGSSEYATRGMAYSREGHHDQAIAEFGKALELDPSDAEAYFHRGEAYSQKGDYDHAISDFNETLRINPSNREAYSKLRVAYVRRNQSRGATSTITDSASTKPASTLAEKCYKRGIAYARKGRYYRAIADFTDALRINAQYVEAYYARGEAYLNEEQYDQAISDFSKALELKPTHLGPYIKRGLAYAGKGQLDRAVTEYNKALDIDPGNQAAYVNRGALYSRRGKFGQAVSDFTRALEINPQDARARRERGFAYAFQMQYDRAIADYTSALQMNPRDAVAYSHRASAYTYRGEYDQAISDITKALSIDPNNAQDYCNRGFAYASKVELDRAIADYNRALELNPQLSIAYTNRGIAYLAKGQLDHAISDLTKSLAISSGGRDAGQAYKNRALAYRLKGELNKARTDEDNARTFGLDMEPNVLTALRENPDNGPINKFRERESENLGPALKSVRSAIEGWVKCQDKHGWFACSYPHGWRRFYSTSGPRDAPDIWGIGFQSSQDGTCLRVEVRGGPFPEDSPFARTVDQWRSVVRLVYERETTLAGCKARAYCLVRKNGTAFPQMKVNVEKPTALPPNKEGLWRHFYVKTIGEGTGFLLSASFKNTSDPAEIKKMEALFSRFLDGFQILKGGEQLADVMKLRGKGRFPEVAWDNWVKDFIRKYQLNAAQKETANAMLKQAKHWADKYRQSHAAEINAAKDKLKELLKSEDRTPIKEAQKHLIELYEPMSGLFNSLKDRVNAIPTESQKAAYKKAREASIKRTQTLLRPRATSKAVTESEPKPKPATFKDDSILMSEDGTYSDPAGSGGSYRDPVHGFFEVEPPKGFQTKVKWDKTKLQSDPGGPARGRIIPRSWVQFHRGQVEIGVIARKTYSGLEEDFAVALEGLRKTGAAILRSGSVKIDGVEGREVLSSIRGARVLQVRYKKHGLDHAITIICPAKEFTVHREEFLSFLQSYRSIPGT